MDPPDTPPSLYPGPKGDFDKRLRNLSKHLRVSRLPFQGLDDTESHLQEISRAIIRGKAPSYFGFVTGGVTPIAAKADNLVTELDANVQVHIPDASIATDVEDACLRWILELIRFDENEWAHRTLTTGATASNVLGLAMARDYVVMREAQRRGYNDVSVAHLGLHGALHALGMDGIQILTTDPHSSLIKAASIVGLGRNAVIDVSHGSMRPLFDIDLLTQALQEESMLNIVVVSCGEVNTGRFATTQISMRVIRGMCDARNAWIHVDAAFGFLARTLPNYRYPLLADGVAAIELADSVTADAHKLFNVPYDCGLFFSRHPQLATSVFQNPNAAYLSLSSEAGGPITSPLHIGIENSRRFRALPLYASLRAYGRQGFSDMLERQISTARRIAHWILEHEAYDLLPSERWTGFAEPETAFVYEANYEDIFMIVIFRAKDHELNRHLVELINASREIYVSGTAWDGEPAARIAIANWQVVPERESKTVAEVLDEIARSWNEQR